MSDTNDDVTTVDLSSHASAKLAYDTLLTENTQLKTDIGKIEDELTELRECYYERLTEVKDECAKTVELKSHELATKTQELSAAETRFAETTAKAIALMDDISRQVETDRAKSESELAAKEQELSAFKTKYYAFFDKAQVLINGIEARLAENSSIASAIAELENLRLQ